MVMRRALTLIEVLVVIAIIGVLAGLVIGTMSGWGDRSKAARTRVILGMVQQGLATHLAAGGTQLAPIEHPLAGSRAPRSAFIRAGDSSVVADTGLALVGLERLDAVPTAYRPRVLLGEDLCADLRYPALYALPRHDLAILGAAQQTATQYRRLADTGDVIADPDASGRAINPGGNPADHSAALRLTLDATILAELEQVGGLAEPPSTHTVALLGGRVVASADLFPQWAPGRLQEGTHWRSYALPGASLRDGWGRELLASMADIGGRVRLLSAGRDGVFTWNPGPDGAIATPIADVLALLHGGGGTAAGDDRRGDQDNLGMTLGGRGP